MVGEAALVCRAQRLAIHLSNRRIDARDAALVEVGVARRQLLGARLREREDLDLLVVRRVLPERAHDLVGDRAAALFEELDDLALVGHQLVGPDLAVEERVRAARI